nr:hypothetical protein [Micromonospora sp. DSM 115978]
MSFEELMDHAVEIRRKAIEKAMIQHGVRPATAEGEPAPAPRPGEAETRQEIESGFADVPEIFSPFAELPLPGSLDGLIDSLDGALEVLSTGESPRDPINGTIYGGNPELDKLSGAESYVEDWTGRAAMNFKASFIDPFPTIVRNQFLIAVVLKSALEAQREIWVRVRRDIDKIAHDTLEALDRMDDCGKNEWTMTFTVVGSVVSIAAAPLTGGWSLALTAVAAASQIAVAALPDDPPSVRFGGESAEAVVQQARDAAALLIESIQTQEAKIANAMSETHDLVLRRGQDFVSDRPTLAGATENTITGPDYMGYSR